MNIKDYKKAWNTDDFDHKCYDMETFMNMAANCEFEASANSSRRDATELKNTFKKNI